MWAAIVATIVQFRPVIGNLALVLLGPYLLWVSYAGALTLWIWRHNDGKVRVEEGSATVGVACTQPRRCQHVALPHAEAGRLSLLHCRSGRCQAQDSLSGQAWHAFTCHRAGTPQALASREAEREH
jgi:hypothetical protein